MHVAPFSILASGVSLPPVYGGRYQLSYRGEDGATAFSSFVVAADGTFVGTLNGQSVAGLVGSDGVSWSYSIGSDSGSFVWNGRGVAGDLPVTGGVVRVSEVGARLPGEAAADLGPELALGFFALGLFLWVRFVTSYRRRSLDL